MNTKSSRKSIYDKLQVLIFNCFLVFLSYGIMLTHRYSIDGYAVFFEFSEVPVGYPYLSSGRLVNWLLINLLSRLGFNPVNGQKYFTFVFMLVIALCITLLFLLFSSLIFGRSSEGCPSGFPRQTFRGALFLDLAIALAFINVFVNEFFLFSEVSLFWAVMFFFSVLASCFFLCRGGWWKYLLSALLLWIALNSYQASLGIFLIFGCAGILVKNDLCFSRKTIREVLLLLLIGGLVVLLALLPFPILTRLGVIGTDARAPSFHLATVLHNLVYLFSMQRLLLVEGMSFIHLWVLVFLVALLCVLGYLLWKNRCGFASSLLVFLAFIGCYACVFAPHLFTNGVYPAVRTMFSFFSVFSFLCIIILYILHRNHKKLPMALIYAILAFLIINTVKIQQVAAEQFAVNIADRTEAVQVINAIDKYENATGNTIDTIAYRSDAQRSRTYPGITNTFLDFGRRADAASWAVVNRLSYYSGKSYTQISMSKEEYSLHFPEKDWYVFDAEEQLVFEGNVMYWALY